MSVKNDSSLLLVGFPNYGTFTEVRNENAATVVRTNVVATQVIAATPFLLNSEQEERMKSSMNSLEKDIIPLVRGGSEESKGKIAKLLQEIAVILGRIQPGSRQRGEFEKQFYPLVQTAVLERILPCSSAVLGYMN